jgi:hypothetical protein
MTHTIDTLMALHDKAVDEATKYDEMCFNGYDIQPVLDARDSLRKALTEALTPSQKLLHIEYGTTNNEIRIKQLEDACKVALDALKNCYDVDSYPANGKTTQDYAIAKLQGALQ